MDALIANFTKAAISSNITGQLSSAIEKTNKLENLVEALNERVKKVEASNTNITTNLNASLNKISMNSKNMTAKSSLHM